VEIRAIRGGEKAMPLKLEIVTQERRVYSAEDVEMVTAPGGEGEMGILPSHAPLITSLQEGVMRVKRQGGQEEVLAIHGGFMEVLPDQVTVLADSAERAEEIDVARAQEARRRAEELMKQHREDKVDYVRAEAALRRSFVRLKIAQSRRQRAVPTPRSD
jgi:F-type H+-transporting ATPase subunit epsilon